VRLPAELEAVERIAAALPLVRESAGVLHLPPGLMRTALEEPRIRASAALLRADLASDRALTPLVTRDLIDRGLRVAVLTHPPSWLAARLVQLGLPPTDPLPARLRDRLLEPLPTEWRRARCRRP